MCGFTGIPKSLDVDKGNGERSVSDDWECCAATPVFSGGFWLVRIV
jgi:hypothetical protein